MGLTLLYYCIFTAHSTQSALRVSTANNMGLSLKDIQKPAR